MNREEALIEKIAAALHDDVYPEDNYPWSGECRGAKDNQRKKARVALTAIAGAGMVVVPREHLDVLRENLSRVDDAIPELKKHRTNRLFIELASVLAAAEKGE